MPSPPPLPTTHNNPARTKQVLEIVAEQFCEEGWWLEPPVLSAERHGIHEHEQLLREGSASLDPSLHFSRELLRPRTLRWAHAKYRDPLPAALARTERAHADKHAGAAVGRRGRARGGSGEGGGSGGVQGHRAPIPLKLDPPRTLPDAWTPTPMSFREGLGAPGSHFHAKLLRGRPHLRQPAAQRVSERRPAGD